MKVVNGTDPMMDAREERVRGAMVIEMIWQKMGIDRIDYLRREDRE
jgi:hypothetical protein